MSHFQSSSVAIRDVIFGNNVSVTEPVNMYECSIGDDCFIGPFVEIQKGVLVGNKTRIQSHSFLCELVTIGENCFIGHGVMFINDDLKTGAPAGRDKSKWKATNVGNNVMIGSNATILPVNIIEGAVIGAGSVVTKDITVKGIFAGNPAVLLRRL
jgi:acetyltransferase-like isoleucine patch superfamily enzyme